MSQFLRSVRLLITLITVVLVSHNVVANTKTTKPESITVAVNKTSFPYHFVDDNQEVSGVMPELWQLWGKKMGIEVKFVPLSWQETLAQVKEGKVDFHAGLSFSDERAEYLQFSPSVFQHSSFIYVSSEIAKIQSVGELKPYTIGVVDGAVHAEVLKRKHPLLSLRYYNNRHELYDAAVNGEILLFAGLEKTSMPYERLEQLKLSFPEYLKIPLEQFTYHSAMSKNQPEKYQLMLEGFALISAEETKHIYDKWVGEVDGSNKLKVSFTLGHPPYTDISPTGRPHGLFIDIWKLWAEQSGQEITFYPELESEGLSLLDQDKVDVHIAFANQNFDPQKHRNAAKIYQIQYGVFIANSFAERKTFASLSGLTIGGFKNSASLNALKQKNANILIKEFDSAAELMRAAEDKLIDGMVASVDYLGGQLVEYKLNNAFVLMKNLLASSDVYSVTSNKETDLALRLAAEFKQLDLHQLINIEQQWLPARKGGYFSSLLFQQGMSPLQLDWLENLDAIKLGVIANRKPMEFKHESDIQGINVDILEKALSQLNLPLKVLTFDSITALHQALLEKKVDLVSNLYTANNNDSASFTSVNFDKEPWVILHRAKTPQITSVKALSGKRLAVLESSPVIPNLLANFPDIQLMIVDSPEQAILVLENDVVDGFISVFAIASDMMQRDSLVQLNISVTDLPRQDIGFYLLKQSEAATVVSNLLSNLTEHDKHNALAKWLKVSIKTGLEKDEVFRMVMQFSVLVIIAILAVLLWNRRLRSEIIRRKELELRMKHMATHDELTGLPNRAMLKEKINTAIAMHSRQQLMMAVLFIDLDGFKSINDTYGHNIGDELLVILAKRLKSCVRLSDIVARFGGDEFIILLTGLHNRDEAAIVAEKVLHKMQTPVELSVCTSSVGASIGIAMYPEDAGSEIELLKIADTLMYQVKYSGKNSYSFLKK